MLRVVFDTVIFLRALINPRGTWGRLVLDQTQNYKLVLSKPVIEETLEVIDRPLIKQKYRLQEFGMRSMLEIIAQAEVVEIPTILPVSRDPKDDKFLATAMAAAANYLVSEDADLLVLREYSGIPIVDARTFLNILNELE